MKTILNFRNHLIAFLASFLLTSLLSAQTNMLNHYFTPPNGWQVDKHVRTTGDVNGDGLDDLVGFGGAGVFVSYSNGQKFTEPKLLLRNLAIGAGAWEVDKHPRMMGDVNGDGKDDIIGYGGPGVFVALSTGNGFEEAKVYLKHSFTAANGWQSNQHVRTVGDINGDGKTDLVGFGGGGVYVAYSTGNAFSKPVMLFPGFAINKGGWSVEKHTRMVADVNGDGKDDIIAIGEDNIFGAGQAGVFVSLSLGKAFAPPVNYLKHYFTAANGWNNKLHVRTAADINGDGKADLIGFGGGGVFASLGTGVSFQKPKMILKNFAQNAGMWRVNKHVRTLADVNGDKQADIVGFGGGAVLVNTNLKELEKNVSLVKVPSTSANISEKKNNRTDILNARASSVKNIDGGKYITYTMPTRPNIPIGSRGNIASMNIQTAASIKDDILYVHVSTLGTSIDINQANYKDSDYKKGYFLEKLVCELDVLYNANRQFDLERHGPTNLNEESGTYTDMEYLSFGAGLDPSGGSTGVEYRMGSSFSKKLNAFRFEDEKYGSDTKFTWTMSASDGGEYNEPWDLGKMSAGQVSSLYNPPASASKSFDVYCQSIVKKDLRPNGRSVEIPDEITIRVKLSSKFRSIWLKQNQQNEVQAFFEGFVFWANPKTYDGTLLYELKNSEVKDDIYVDVVIDLTPLKEAQ